jgi:hypothetical protein
MMTNDHRNYMVFKHVMLDHLIDDVYTVICCMYLNLVARSFEESVVLHYNDMAGTRPTTERFGEIKHFIIINTGIYMSEYTRHMSGYTIHMCDVCRINREEYMILIDYIDKPWDSYPLYYCNECYIVRYGIYYKKEMIIRSAYDRQK